jgi:hypothetical protein
MAYSDKEIEEVFNHVCLEIEKGHALRNVLKDDNMPSTSTFYQWLDSNEEKAKQYARATQVRADIIFDEIIDIADDSSGDKKVVEHGEVMDGEYVARSRIRIDTRKWVLSKLNPKKYGDKTDITSGGEKINTPQEVKVTIVRNEND